MSEAFVIEVDDEAAGIVVRNGRSYRFYASHARYIPLEGTAFTSASKAELAARKMLAAQRTAANAG